MKKLLIIALSLFNLVSLYSQNNVEDLNLNFEKIEVRDSIWHMPVNWSILNPQFGGEIVPNSYKGNWAVKIWTWYSYIAGNFFIGNDLTKGISFSDKPIYLNGYYKYIWGNNRGNKDSAEITLYLTKYDRISHKIDTIGKGYTLLDSATNFTLFKIPITYKSSNIPDTLLIDFLSHKKLNFLDSNGIPLSGRCGGTGNCLYLTVDALSFDFATPTEEIKNLKSPITIHPNPTSNSIQIDWGENSVSDIIIKDTLGRIIQKKAVNTEGVNLDLSNLPIGLYFIEFNQNGKHLATRKVVKQ